MVGTSAIMESDRASIVSDTSTGLSSTYTGKSHTRKFAPAISRPGQARATREAVQTTLSQPNPAVSLNVYLI